MSDPDQRIPPDRDHIRRRMRDFIVLTTGGVAVLVLLLFTSAIGLVEWITGSVVMVAGSLAYYVGSLPPAGRPDHFTQKNTSPQPKIDTLSLITPVLAAFPFPALMVNKEERIAFANRDAQSVFRLDSSSGDLATAAIRQPDLLAAFARVAQSSSPEQVEFSLGDDEDAWLAHIRTGPEPGTVIAVFEDQTAVRQAERARADFLANASHELRTPLTAIGGFVETMRGPAKDDKDSWDGFLSIIQEQTDRMKRLVADLLSLSRIEFSEHRAPAAHADMRNIVEAAGLSLQTIAADASVDLQLDLPDGPVPIIADRDEIEQVIQNLASNAIKYAQDRGHVRVTLGTAPTMTEAAALSARQTQGAIRAMLLSPRASARAPAMWLRVEDNGPGIPSQHLPRLGERFYRADESRGGTIPGTGLGLAIVKHIMARHRGGLAVESVEGQTTAFGVWMPVLQSANT